MARITVTRCGRARHYEDGTWDFPDGLNPSVVIEEGDIVGFGYEVAGDGTSADVDLSIVFHAANDDAPAPEYRTTTVETGAEFFRNAAPPADLLGRERALRATFSARTGPGATASGSILILPADIGRVSSGRSFAPATEADIAAFEGGSTRRSGRTSARSCAASTASTWCGTGTRAGSPDRRHGVISTRTWRRCSRRSASGSAPGGRA